MDKKTPNAKKALEADNDKLRNAINKTPMFF